MAWMSPLAPATRRALAPCLLAGPSAPASSAPVAASRCAVLKAASAAFCQLSPFGTSAAAAADDEQHAASTPSSTAAPSAGAGPAAESAPGSGQPSPASITDLPAKLALLEAVGVSPAAALQHYTPYLCSPAHHVATRLAFLEARTKLRRPPRLWQVICPSDTELCQKHGLEVADLEAFRREYLASDAWRQLCERHGVVQAQPEVGAGGAGGGTAGA